MKESKTDFYFKQSTPVKLKKNSGIFLSKDIIENENRFLQYGDTRRSFSGKHDYHKLNNLSIDKYLKNQEKIDENSESYKELPNSLYNDFSEDNIEKGAINPLELQNAQFSNLTDEKMKSTLENLKDRLPKKYVKT